MQTFPYIQIQHLRKHTSLSLSLSHTHPYLSIDLSIYAYLPIQRYCFEPTPDSLSLFILKVSDNLSRALAAVPADARSSSPDASHLENLVVGVEMTERELIKIFEAHGIKRFSPLKEKFDPIRHAAMFQNESDDMDPGTVSAVLKCGFMLHDRVLRPAEVGVVKARPQAPASSS